MTDVKHSIATLKADSAPEKTEAILRKIAKAKVSKIESAMLISEIDKQLGGGFKRPLVAEFQKIAKELAADAREADHVNKHGVDGPPRLTYSSLGYYATLELVWNRIWDLNDEEPFLFSFADSIARVRESRGSLRAEPLGYLELRNEVSKLVKFETGDDHPLTMPPPEDVIKDMMVEVDNGLPYLRAVVRMPFFTKSGGKIAMVSRHGFNEDSGFYLHPLPGLKLPVILEHPSDADVAAALALIDEVYAEFPFDDGEESGRGDSSRDHLLALQLQPFVMSVIEAPTPFYFIIKPAAGTGATLLGQTVTRIATGAPATAQTEIVNDENEMRKTILSFLLGGEPIFWIDNVNAKVASSALANLATNDGPTGGRMLGKSKAISLKSALTLILSGNNVEVHPEMARRLVPIRMDAKVTDPTNREFTLDLKAHIAKHHSELVTACLTIVQHWVAIGAPNWKGRDGVKPLASFEQWSRIMGGILESVGRGEHFLGNLQLAREASEIADDLSALLSLWCERDGLNRKRTIRGKAGDADLISMALTNGLDLGLPDNEDIALKVLSKKLAKVRNTIMAASGKAVRFRAETNAHTHKKVFWFEDVASPLASHYASMRIVGGPTAGALAAPSAPSSGRGQSHSA